MGDTNWVKILLWSVLIVVAVLLGLMILRWFVQRPAGTTQESSTQQVFLPLQEDLGSRISQGVENPGSALPETNPFEALYENPFR